MYIYTVHGSIFSPLGGCIRHIWLTTAGNLGSLFRTKQEHSEDLREKLFNSPKVQDSNRGSGITYVVYDQTN